MPPVAGTVSDVAVVLDRAASVVAWGYTGWTVVHDAKRHSALSSLEAHSGDIASMGLSAVAGGALAAAAAGVILAVGAPAIVAAVGAVAVVGVTAAGAGSTVQSIVNHRKEIGHFVESVL